MAGETRNDASTMLRSYERTAPLARESMKLTGAGKTFAHWDENGQVIEEHLFYDLVTFMKRIGLA